MFAQPVKIDYKPVSELWSIDNAVFTTFIFWSSVLIVKTLFMVVLTAFQRFKNQSFVAVEDVKFVKWLLPKSVVEFDNPHVERVRRAHLNDLENIWPQILAGFFYVLTEPEETLAVNLIRVAAICRILHTFCYAIYPLPQPARFFAFIVPYVITGFMAMHTALHIYFDRLIYR